MLTGLRIHSSVILSKDILDNNVGFSENNHYIVAMMLYTHYTPYIQVIYCFVQSPYTADRGGYKMHTYVLAILQHI